MKKPFIGITSSIRANDAGREYCEMYTPNARAVERAGGLPVVIPSVVDANTLRAIYERLDGVLLPGGGDIDPIVYGAKKHPATARIDPVRDATEIEIARWAVEDDRALFAICRGIQVMNVALGGTLIQDIPTQVEAALTHDMPGNRPRSTIAHDVTIDKTSRLARILGKTTIPVNSLHHQSSDHPGQSICFTAYAPDGVVEALEIPNRHFAIGVQWHPEDLVDDESAQALFRAFVHAAAERSS